MATACLLAVVSMADGTRAMTYYWGRHPEKERLVFAFTGTIPNFKIVRSGKKTISLILPPTIWDKEPPPTPVDLSVSRMVTRVQDRGRTMQIDLDTAAFGFIYFPLADENKLVLDIFRDPMGAKWHPSPPPRAIPAQTTANKTVPLPKGAQGAVPTQPTPLPTPVPDPAPQARSAGGSKTTNASRVGEGFEKKPAPPKEETGPRPQDSLPTPLPEKPHPTAPTQPGTLRMKVSFQTAKEAFSGTDTADPKTGSDQTIIPDVPTPKKISFPANRTAHNASADGAPPQPLSQEPPAGQAAKPANSTDIPAQSPPPASANQTMTGEGEQTAEGTKNATSTPHFKDYLITAKATLQNGEFDAALDVLQGMLAHPKFPADLREETLYVIADALFQKYHNDLDNHFQEVMSAFQQAVNYNPKSLRLSSAMLSMGLINLKVGNVPEARAYFRLLRDKYPNDSNTPLTYFYMGEHYLAHKKYQKAADAFQYVVQKFPDSSMVQSCAVGLTRALKELGFYKQGFEIMDYVQKRWPRYHIKDPDFLMLAGYIKLKNDKLEGAKKDFWVYANLTPGGKNVDIALARIGDIYVMLDKKQAAKDVYEKIARTYPDQEGGLIAKMRLAEEGVFDTPSLKKMYSVFDKPYSLRPKQVYTQIIEKYPDSPLAPVAQLKLAMWQLWSDTPQETLQTVAGFVRKYPDQELLPKALEVGKKAFDQWVAKAIEMQRYGDIVSTWEKYPFLHSSPIPMTRLAVATGYWKTDRAAKGLDLAGPFLNGSLPQGPASGPALDLVLAILVKSQSWQQIIDMTRQVKSWELSPARRRQFEYTLAIAHQNLGLEDKSHPLWLQLASDIELPDSQRAYALYFLSKHARESEDLEKEYMLAQQALSLFLSTDKRDLPKIRDCLAMLIDVTSRTRRHQEALGWGMEYEKYMDKDDPSWPSHMYTLANLFKLNQDMDMWKKKLISITKTYPDSIYSKMATRDLETADLQKKMRSFE